ncbi:MAG: dihydrofolate reductase [Lachnospiraceae bacterium]
MNIIVAADKNWAIGFRGQLLVQIPADQRFFREETTGKVIVMGRKTFESLPGKQPLPHRVNIIMTTKANYKVKGAIVTHSMEETLELLKSYRDEDIFIIGGSKIYKQFLPYVDTVHATKIDYAYQADTWFPLNLDKSDEWAVTAVSDEQTYFNLEYYFKQYSRIK